MQPHTTSNKSIQSLSFECLYIEQQDLQALTSMQESNTLRWKAAFPAHLH